MEGQLETVSLTETFTRASTPTSVANAEMIHSVLQEMWRTAGSGLSWTKADNIYHVRIFASL